MLWLRRQHPPGLSTGLLFLQKRRINPVDASHQRMYKLLPQTQAQKQRRRKRALTYLEELDQHTFSVKCVLN